MIFVPTLPQSGTWFALKLLEKCGFKIEFTDGIIKDKNRVLEHTPIAFSTHIFPFYYQGSEFKEALPSFGSKAIKDYIVREHHMCLGSIEVLASMHKTIIPIRDPLSCLLTRENRAPQLRHFYITDGFIEVINRFENHPNVFFFPVDLHNNYVDRQALVYDLLKHCNIVTNKRVAENVDDYVLKWEKQNTTENRFREPYENNDINKIKEMLGSKWAEVEHLKHFGGTIWPFLSKLGYTEKLW